MNIVEVYSFKKQEWERVEITQENQYYLDGCTIESYDIDDEGFVRLRLADTKHVLIRDKKEFLKRGRGK